MVYDKMNDFIESIFTVFKMVNIDANSKKNKKMMAISLIIYNYVLKLSKTYNVDLKNIPQKESINLIPFFEYISHNNIELYDFDKIKIEDVDVSKESDLERFVLTHIYYITQKTQNK
jgi:hypothetical protein